MIKRCRAVELKAHGGPEAAESQSHGRARVRGAETKGAQSGEGTGKWRFASKSKVAPAPSPSLCTALLLGDHFSRVCLLLASSH